jgi:prolyl oligopeptidase
VACQQRGDGWHAGGQGPFERGGIFAVVNVRGGGEYGEAWHKAAMREHFQTKLDDFNAAAAWLVANHVAGAGQVGAIGTSGGGMLVGGAVVQHPELFGCAFPIAGVLDLLRFQLFGQGAGWQEDLGHPDDAKEFPALRAVSPLHNVRAGSHYPPMLVVTSDHDVRVAPLHSYKFAAALQAAQAGGAPILLHVDIDSGHGGGSQVSQQIEQHSDNLAFAAKYLRLGN